MYGSRRDERDPGQVLDLKERLEVEELVLWLYLRICRVAHASSEDHLGWEDVGLMKLPEALKHFGIDLLDFFAG